MSGQHEGHCHIDSMHTYCTLSIIKNEMVKTLTILPCQHPPTVVTYFDVWIAACWI